MPTNVEKKSQYKARKNRDKIVADYSRKNLDTTYPNTHSKIKIVANNPVVFKTGLLFLVPVYINIDNTSKQLIYNKCSKFTFKSISQSLLNLIVEFLARLPLLRYPKFLADYHIHQSLLNYA